MSHCFVVKRKDWASTSKILQHFYSLFSAHRLALSTCDNANGAGEDPLNIKLCNNENICDKWTLDQTIQAGIYQNYFTLGGGELVASIEFEGNEESRCIDYIRVDGILTHDSSADIWIYQNEIIELEVKSNCYFKSSII